MEEKSAEFVQILSPVAWATREGFQKGINEMKKLIFTRKWRDKRRITQADFERDLEIAQLTVASEVTAFNPFVLFISFS
jgi:hypothetical protein